MRKELDSPAGETAAEICAARGLQIAGSEQKGSVLLIYPEPGAELPSAEALRGLAAALAGKGVHFVTLCLDEYAGGEGRGQNGE